MRSLDYEVTQGHSLTVVVTDQGLLPQRQATSTVTVTVEDVNDNTPVSTPLSGPHSLLYLPHVLTGLKKNAIKDYPTSWLLMIVDYAHV